MAAVATDLPLAGSRCWGMICTVPLLLGLGTERQGWLSSCMYISSCSTYGWEDAHIGLSSGSIQMHSSFCRESKMCTVGSPQHGQGWILSLCSSTLRVPRPPRPHAPSAPIAHLLHTNLPEGYRTSGMCSITSQDWSLGLCLFMHVFVVQISTRCPWR